MLLDILSGLWITEQEAYDFFSRFAPTNPDHVLLILAFGALLFSLWTLFWKGCALWVAAMNKQPKWFIALLAINTLGLLEIAFLLHHYKKGTLKLKK